MKALDLLPDGTVTIRDGVREWRTRRPTIGEWRTIFEATEAIDAEAQSINAMPATDLEEIAAKGAARKEFRKRGQWTPAVALVLSMLSPADETVGPDSLPLWCGAAGVIVAILEHWEEVPLDLSPVTETNGSSDRSEVLSPPV